MEADRAEMLATMNNLAAIVTPLVVLACGLWVGLLALANVRERTGEIGLLRAIGKSSSLIAGLFLSRAMLIGLAGGAAGFLLGKLLAEQLGARIFDVSAAQASPQAMILIYALLGAPILCALAAWLPTLRAIVQDPAVVLRDA
jgi:putative ABC transport system permease protein